MGVGRAPRSITRSGRQLETGPIIGPAGDGDRGDRPAEDGDEAADDELLQRSRGAAQPGPHEDGARRSGGSVRRPCAGCRARSRSARPPWPRARTRRPGRAPVRSAAPRAHGSRTRRPRPPPRRGARPASRAANRRSSRPSSDRGSTGDSRPGRSRPAGPRDRAESGRGSARNAPPTSARISPEDRRPGVSCGSRDDGSEHDRERDPRKGRVHGSRLMDRPIPAPDASALAGFRRRSSASSEATPGR